MSAIAIRDLQKSYGDYEILKGVNLKIEEGEFYALMGPNGSGKTTLTSIIACTSLPSSGTVEIYGYDTVEEAEKVKKLIGYVPQENFSSTHLTGKENAIYFARLFGFSKDEAKKIARDMLEKMGLFEDAEKRVSNYSGGMRKRLEVATALLPGVKVLILDEPTTGLDPSARKNFLGLIKKVNDEGATVFFVTHIGEDAEIASRVGFMDKGKIVMNDEPERLRKRSGLRNVVNVETSIKSDEVFNVLRQFSDDGKILETEKGFKIYCKSPEEIAPSIVKSLDKIGCKVTRIETMASSLEDIFFKFSEMPLRR
jgi:ABC-2 type transport system ATP-binding protein